MIICRPPAQLAILDQLPLLLDARFGDSDHDAGSYERPGSRACSQT